MIQKQTGNRKKKNQNLQIVAHKKIQTAEMLSGLIL